MQEGCHRLVQPRPLPHLQVFLSQLDQAVDLLRVALVNADGLVEGWVEPVIDGGWKDVLQDGVDRWGVGDSSLHTHTHTHTNSTYAHTTGTSNAIAQSWEGSCLLLHFE